MGQPSKLEGWPNSLYFPANSLNKTLALLIVIF